MKRTVLLLALIGAVSGVASAQTTFYFPQIADGTQTGGFWTTSIFIANPTSSGTANVTITFTKSNGDPFNVSFVDENNQPVGSGNVVTLAAITGGSPRKIVSTASSGAVSNGFATVVSDSLVTGSAVFTLFSGVPGQGSLVAEAGVSATTPVLNQAIFVDESTALTALAYANPSTTATANVTLRLLNTQAVQVQTTAVTLAPNNHTALFVFQAFSGSVTGHVGSMQLLSDTALVSTSLRFTPDFSKFSSVPPFTLASLILPLESWTRPVAAWVRHRPWLSPLASFARILGTLQFPLG